MIGHDRPESGSGAGRPCYIAHDQSWPERECDGLHGTAMIDLFHSMDAEAGMAAARRAIKREQEQPMQTRRENNKLSARTIGVAGGYIIGGIIVLAIVALVGAGAWWAVAAVWGAVL